MQSRISSLLAVLVVVGFLGACSIYRSSDRDFFDGAAPSGSPSQSSTSALCKQASAQDLTNAGLDMSTSPQTSQQQPIPESLIFSLAAGARSNAHPANVALCTTTITFPNGGLTEPTMQGILQQQMQLLQQSAVQLSTTL